MINKITESEIEEFSIELLEGLSYQYIHGLDIAPDLPVREHTQTGGEMPEWLDKL